MSEELETQPLKATKFTDEELRKFDFSKLPRE